MDTYKKINTELILQVQEMRITLAAYCKQIVELRANLQDEHLLRVEMRQRFANLLNLFYRDSMEEIDPDAKILQLLRDEDCSVNTQRNSRRTTKDKRRSFSELRSSMELQRRSRSTSIPMSPSRQRRTEWQSIEIAEECSTSICVSNSENENVDPNGEEIPGVEQEDEGENLNNLDIKTEQVEGPINEILQLMCINEEEEQSELLVGEEQTLSTQTKSPYVKLSNSSAIRSTPFNDLTNTTEHSTTTSPEWQPESPVVRRRGIRKKFKTKTFRIQLVRSASVENKTDPTIKIHPPTPEMQLSKNKSDHNLIITSPVSEPESPVVRRRGIRKKIKTDSSSIQLARYESVENSTDSTIKIHPPTPEMQLSKNKSSDHKDISQGGCSFATDELLSSTPRNSSTYLAIQTRGELNVPTKRQQSCSTLLQQSNETVNNSRPRRICTPNSMLEPNLRSKMRNDNLKKNKKKKN